MTLWYAKPREYGKMKKFSGCCTLGLESEFMQKKEILSVKWLSVLLG
jgi:hypothetical protein